MQILLSNALDSNKNLKGSKFPLFFLELPFFSLQKKKNKQTKNMPKLLINKAETSQR